MSELPRPDQSSAGRVPDSPPISVRHDVAPTRRDASSPAGSGQVVNFGEKPRAASPVPFIVTASDSPQEVKQKGNDAASERGVAANDGAQAVVEEIGTLDRQVGVRSEAGELRRALLTAQVEAREGGDFSAKEPGGPSFQRLANTPEGRDRQLLNNILPPGAVDAKGNPRKGIPAKLSNGETVLINPDIFFRGAGESTASREPSDDRESVSPIHDAGGDSIPDRDVASGSEVPNRSVQSNEVDNDVSKTSELHAEVREPITIHDRTDGGDVQPEVSDTGKRKTIDIATPDFDHGSQDEWESFLDHTQ